jgi:5-formyltetrahydrofolate cyclo-ligase
MSGTQPPDLARWRKSLRQELIARREAVAPAQRRDWGLSISLQLLRAVPWKAGGIVGFCWPYRGEYDARHLLRSLRNRGTRSALPVIDPASKSMRFQLWSPGTPMEKGPMGIPYPVGSPVVDPDILLVPLVGFGRSGDRLGYGGGYFDRTLAVLEPRPLAIGVGFELCQIDSSFPQPHDILLDAIVTEAALRWQDSGKLEAVGARTLRERLEDLAQVRHETSRLTAHTVPNIPPSR